jgi:hypothetical protein
MRGYPKAIPETMNSKATPHRPGIVAAILIGATLAIAGTSGCATTGASFAIAYVRGDLDATLDVPLESALRAANRAVAQLEFSKVSERKDALQAILIARNAADTKVEIRLQRDAESETKLKIRVGTFGDEALAVATYTKISANL